MGTHIAEARHDHIKEGTYDKWHAKIGMYKQNLKC